MTLIQLLKNIVFSILYFKWQVKYWWLICLNVLYILFSSISIHFNRSIYKNIKYSIGFVTNPVLCTCYIIQVHSRQRLIWKNIEKKRKQGGYHKSILFQQHFKYKINKETHHLPDLRSTIYLIKFVVSIQVQIGNEAST